MKTSNPRFGEGFKPPAPKCKNCSKRAIPYEERYIPVSGFWYCLKCKKSWDIVIPYGITLYLPERI